MATAIPSPEPNAFSREHYLARARGLVPVLRERAERAEADRSVPAESVAAFKAAGLIRMTQPVRYGGAAMGWDVLCEVAQTLAAADGAQAWVQAITADHAVLLGTWDGRAQEDVWGRDPEAVMAASFEPRGDATPCDGGYRFGGHFGFASGIDHADWLICGGFVVDGDRRDGPHFFLVPRSDVRIVDDWHTAGLEGTGSKSFVVDDAFVPAHRRLDGAAARAGTAPGAALDDAPVYRLPRGGFTPTIFAALATGMAKGLLDEWLRYTAGRLNRGEAMAANPGSHMIAGECSARIASAEALYLATIRDGMRRLAEGELLTAADTLIAKRNAAWAARSALEAGTRLFNAGGGRAIYRANAMQRQYRNLCAACAHITLAWETAAMAAGRELIERAGSA